MDDKRGFRGCVVQLLKFAPKPNLWREWKSSSTALHGQIPFFASGRRWGLTFHTHSCKNNNKKHSCRSGRHPKLVCYLDVWQGTLLDIWGSAKQVQCLGQSYKSCFCHCGIHVLNISKIRPKMFSLFAGGNKAPGNNLLKIQLMQKYN